MQKFISCDWGTSTLRLRFVDATGMMVLAETEGSEGISQTFNLWKQSGRKEDGRLHFYQSILKKHIVQLEEQLNFSLPDMPLIISGMASSTIGMMELPYKEVPFSIDGHDLVLKTIKGNEDFRHPIFMISGVRTANDVMRGEETQLTGCLHSDDEEDQIFIFPGTHSKHVKVNNGRAVDFATYMTGEFFELLSQKSILSNNVEADNNLLSTNLKSFETGVTDSSDSHILHTAFLVRTNQLFGKFSKPENYNYLSGLLIGTELQQLIKKDIPLTLVSSKKLEQSYSAALSILGLKFKVQNSEEALIRGQYRILEYNK